MRLPRVQINLHNSERREACVAQLRSEFLRIDAPSCRSTRLANRTKRLLRVQMASPLVEHDPIGQIVGAFQPPAGHDGSLLHGG